MGEGQADPRVPRVREALLRCVREVEAAKYWLICLANDSPRKVWVECREELGQLAATARDLEKTIRMLEMP